MFVGDLFKSRSRLKAENPLSPSQLNVALRQKLSFPKIISGRIDGVARPRSEWLQWRQTVGRLDATAHLSVMPSAYGLDCNTLHRRKESGVGAPRRR
jgi:hypothetical protein